MKYDFYDDMSMINSFMPYDNNHLNNMPNSFKDSVNKMNESVNMNGFSNTNSLGIQNDFDFNVNNFNNQNNGQQPIQQ